MCIYIINFRGYGVYICGKIYIYVGINMNIRLYFIIYRKICSLKKFYVK